MDKRTAVEREHLKALQRQVFECDHPSTVDISTRAFSGPVSRDENPAAHGNVCVEIECERCGSRRSVNANKTHVEYVPWMIDHARQPREKGTA